MRLHEKQDPEITAMVKVMKLLNALPEAALVRVADYVHGWAHGRLAEKGGTDEGKEDAPGETRQKG